MGHLIHRQIMEIKFASQEDAKHWSPRFTELNQRIVLPTLEEAFSAVDGDRTLRIDRLEIDLGKLRKFDLEADLAAVVRSKIEEALLPYQQPQQQVGAPKVAPQKTDLPGQAESVEPMIDAESLAELFEQFLQTGSCPWWLKQELVTQLDLLYQRFWRLAPGSAQQLILQIISEPVGLRRFVEQFSNRSHQLTLQQLLPSVTAELLIDLRKLATHLLARQGFGLQARVVSFKLVYSLIVVSEQQHLEQPQTLMRQFFSTLTQIIGIPATQLHEEVDEAVARLRMIPATKAVLAELLRENDLCNGQKKVLRSRIDASILAADDQLSQSEQPATTTEVAIENAGLVLLWPHLKELFRKLDLLETAGDGNQRPKIEAALLLQQLVNGRPSGQENLLLVNKLLCGIPPTIPIPRRWRRTPRWDAETENLLTAVIEQWSALKNTSMAGLRSSFLQREGFLREQGQGWLLQVERKSHDILLEHLPWGLGMIQFSWMRQPLFIEW